LRVLIESYGNYFRVVEYNTSIKNLEFVLFFLDAHSPTLPYRRCSVPPVPAPDYGSGTKPAPGPPNPHNPGPAPPPPAVDPRLPKRPFLSFGPTVPRPGRTFASGYCLLMYRNRRVSRPDSLKSAVKRCPGNPCT